MFRTTLLRGASAGALTLAFYSTGALAQQSLPVIDIGAARQTTTAARVVGPSRGLTAGGASGPVVAAPRVVDPAKETGYARTTTFSATKTNTPLINTPQSVQVIPREVLQDRQLIDLREAVQNVSGVQAESSGTPYDSYLIRGFASGYGSTYRNGLKSEGLAGTTEIAFTDRVEVVKGPASMLYGRIQPGGFVNIVTKRPQEEFKATLNQQFGSWGLARTVADVTGPVNAEKSVLYRFMAAYDHADSFVNFEHRDNGAAALYLTFRPTQNFEANVQVEHYQKRATSFGNYNGGTIPVNLQYDADGKPLVLPGFNDKPLNLPRNFSSSDPAMWNKFPNRVSRTHYAFDWTYKFNEKWKITNRFQYIDDHDTVNKLANFGFDGTTGEIGRGFWRNFVTRKMLSTNLDVTGELVTGPFTHKLLAGADWYRYEDDWTGDCCGNSLIPSVNVLAPSRGYFGDVLDATHKYAASNKVWRSANQNLGFYAQDQISFFDDRIHLLLGGRWDKFQTTNADVFGGDWEPCYPRCTAYPVKIHSEQPKLSPRAGLLFKLDESTSIYGSYTRSFGDFNGVDANNNLLPPETGVQWEAGLKKLWMDGKVTTTVALFDLRKKNVLQADPFFPGRSVAVGEVTSRGVEFDIAGQVTENLSLIASYTFNPVKITDDNKNGNVGKRYYSAAPNFGNLWAKWDTAPGAAQGWEIGGGVYATDRRYGSNDNSWYMPAYMKFDAMLAYRMPFQGHKLKFQFNVKNLTDTKYFESSNGFAYAFYGAPRTFIGSVNFEY